ncbi:universal stress protein [Formosa sp. PL04]|uniref:universal stress protein n=1 Tax=Formosa sp. PL04 TaxID=3081755 RepID=UPI00298115C2|nr:universal stress protein [Formosa sp. PL04]MDW5288485.1 universal stress protein [Formosa sp. PL04]
MKNILLPTDFSKNAWNAMEYALNLYKDEVCTFYIFNVYYQLSSGPYTGITSSKAREAIYHAQAENSKEGLKEVLSKINTIYNNPKHTYESLSKYEMFSTAVETLVKALNIDCIVMGTKGASAFKEMTLGSNTASLIGLVKCPIIAIPKSKGFKHIKEIGLSTDYDISFTEHGLKPLLSLAISNSSKLSVLHIMDRNNLLTTGQTESLEHLKIILKEVPTEFFTLTDIGVSSGVHAFVESRKLDMLCVVAKEQDFLKRILNHSYSKSISNHSNVPLLILSIKNF